MYLLILCKKSKFVLTAAIRLLIPAIRQIPITLIGWKKSATLLPNNCLTETPDTLALIWLGRKSSERERISERGYV